MAGRDECSPSVPRLGGQIGEQALCHLEHTHSCKNKAREGNVRFDQVQQGPATGGCIVSKAFYDMP